MIFFHDELIPLQHIVESHRDCEYVLSQYIAFQHDMVLAKNPPPLFQHLNRMWIRPQDGTFVCGPEGPSISAFIPYVDEGIARTLLCRQPVPPVPLNLYDSRNLLNHLASWLSGGFIPPWSRREGVVDPVLSFDPHLTVLSTSASPDIVAKFLQPGGDALWKYFGDPDRFQVLMDDGRIRFQHNRPPRHPHFLGFFYADSSYEEKLAFIWLAQASHVFKRLNIPRNDRRNYGLIDSVSLELVPLHTDGTRTFPFNGDEFEFPFYLFARPCLRFSDGFPDIMSWTSSTNLYYWSSDPNGHSQMTEEEHVALGLPCYVSKVGISMNTWSVEGYDFMRDFQEAKGFDPATTDFARSIGVPILEVVYPQKDRFEVVSDENGSSVSTSTTPAGGDAMEVDFESQSDGNVASWPPESVEDMDVDMENCCFRTEGLDVEVGMEVDD
ncbi:hypothetical protein L218DRAFT_509318 [Marasmius fiardii PR-910]|nr:hypothetical protein L218DRAFT_509318 [Marasmius fiardii PR-910]